jgi:hypothetical protein
MLHLHSRWSNTCHEILEVEDIYEVSGHATGGGSLNSLVRYSYPTKTFQKTASLIGDAEKDRLEWEENGGFPVEAAYLPPYVHTGHM